MDTNSLYSALEEEELYEGLRSGKRQEWQFLHSKDCKDWFNADTCSILLSRTCSTKDQKKTL